MTLTIGLWVGWFNVKVCFKFSVDLIRLLTIRLNVHLYRAPAEIPADQFFDQV